MPKPQFKPTTEQRELVRTLAGVGTRSADICLLVKSPDGKPIAEKTLRRHFRAELDEGTVQATAKVARTLYGIATHPGGGSSTVTAAIFWLKTRAGWKETQQVEHTGKDGAPIATTVAMSHIEYEIIDPATNQSSEGIQAPTSPSPV